MTGVGVAVKEIDRVIALGLEGLIQFRFYQHATHRDAAIGDTFGEADHVGNDIIAFRCKSVTESAETCDDLIEDEKNSMAIADRAQSGEIILRRSEDAA